jgi:predicted aldo/keto reductase-like oxidoreductase
MKGDKMADRYFPEIKKHLGFGMMRLPMDGDKIDNAQVCEMVDAFIDNGFNYFDTAHGYHDGLSEIAVRECLTSRHGRSEYILTAKLTDEYFKTQEDIRPLLQQQLDICGVEYFDFYLMHAQNAGNFEFFKECRAYETAFELKKEGKVKHVGLSFHDKAEVLDKILTEYPEVEIVQIQFNYADYEDLSVESRKVYEVCRKHNKPVLVMEPVKGGTLVNLPETGQKLIDDLRAETGSECSNAGYAVRFAASFEGMEVVLSGMSNIEQMNDNMSCMKDFVPLTDKETETLLNVAEAFRALGAIPCTGCRYCIEENHCPMSIRIPDMFTIYNRKLMFNLEFPWSNYETVTAKDHGKASDCIECGMCENVCPQHLEIRELLKKVAAKFE